MPVPLLYIFGSSHICFDTYFFPHGCRIYFPPLLAPAATVFIGTLVLLLMTQRCHISGSILITTFVRARRYYLQPLPYSFLRLIDSPMVILSAARDSCPPLPVRRAVCPRRAFCTTAVVRVGCPTEDFRPVTRLLLFTPPIFANFLPPVFGVSAFGTLPFKAALQTRIPVHYRFNTVLFFLFVHSSTSEFLFLRSPPT